MQKHKLRILSGFLAVIVLSMVVAPVFAIETNYVSTDGFWNWVAGSNSVVQKIVGYGIGSVCPKSDDGYHYANNVYKQGKDGYFDCICTYCGDHFIAYETDIQQSYDDYVQELPATGYASDGSLLVSFRCTDHRISWDSPDINCSNHTVPDYDSSALKVAFSCDSDLISVSLKSGYQGIVAPSFFYGTYDIEFPYDGYYERVESTSIDVRGFLASGSSVSKTGSFKKGSSIYFTAGYTGSYYASIFDFPSGAYFSLSAQFYPIVFKYVPSPSGDINFNSTYSTTTRPTSISGGNYGVVGDNNQITKVENNSSIVNETTNTYYNPATGTTVPIVNWSYDYSDRSYKVTLESGDTSTITYGDENITIQETTVNESGDTITNNYTIYYLVDGSGSDTPVTPPETCAHNWTETSGTPATCTVPGSKLLTCSLCQQTKKEAVPALGHDWQVKQTVTTEYDDTGQLIQEGYTIFECSRCQEQYKSTDGTGPPDTPPDDTGEEGEGFFGWLLHTLSDAIKKLIGGIVDAILKTLDFFFGGDSQSNADFYTSPSTFSGVSVWDY